MIHYRRTFVESLPESLQRQQVKNRNKRKGATMANDRKMTSIFERYYLFAWVLFCIVAGILLWKIVPHPHLARTLDGLAICFIVEPLH